MICAVPVLPGVQTVGVVSESQVPAQATPPLDIVTTPGALDWYENVSAIGVPTELLAEAVKACVLPTSMPTFPLWDVLPVVARITVAGTSF